MLDLLIGDERILYRVVQQRGHDGLIVQVEIGQDTGDFDGMAEIGVAAGALLRPVLLDGKDIGAVDHRFVRIRIVALYPFNKFVLA